MQGMENTNTIPRWDLSSIYPGIDSDEYRQALKDYQSAMDDVSSLLDTADSLTKTANDSFDFATWLSKYLECKNKVHALARTLHAFAYILYSTDTTNTAFLNNITTVEKMGLKVEEQDLRFSRLLLAHQTSLPDFYSRFPEHGEYKYLLGQTIEETLHQMSVAEENLASDLNLTGGSAWGMLHEQIISNLADEEGRTFNELRNMAYDPDPLVRKNAWKKEKELLAQNRIAFAASLNNLKGQTVTLNRRRNYADALDRSLNANRMSRKTLDALIGALEESLPMWRKYFNAKAKILRERKMTASESAGSDKNPGLAFYDLFAPLSSSSNGTGESLLEKKWSFDQARDYVLAEYKSFSDDMHDFAKKAFEEKWIDAEVRPGKVGGAYDEDFPKGHQSRILSNFTGAFSDIITLAHELGHAYHFSCMKGKPPVFFDYPMTLAESASTFAETITKQDMISTSSGNDRLCILDLDLQDASQIFVDILCRFYFENSVFQERGKSELNADDFCRLMLDAQERTYGSGLNDERHEYMWAVKSHYYSTDLDFYNFPYAFGQLFSAALYMRFKKEGPSFAQTYREILSQTGNLSCEDLCAKAGFDITKKEFWTDALELYKREVELFCGEC
ncbi:MAG: M3 family oligoendopeptidase [Treponema sp.]|nr:M3 family oligoendopeptidase [Treponema sp.]